ncbi:MAG: hypothetical protein KKG70_07600 [Proteobacteria bacterium]|nr:hypothetical protein [Pseudomonadota bacterium]
MEKLICADPSVSELDSQLGEIYASLLAGMSVDGAEDLRQQQRQWLITRNLCVDQKCLVKQYGQRIENLNRQLLESQYVGRDMEVVSVIEQTYENAASIVVRFSVPVDSASDFRRYLTILLDGKPQAPDNWLLSEDKLLAVYPFVEPQSKYVIKVEPGIVAINGAAHAGNRSFEIMTRRSEPSAVFAGNGYVMSPHLKRALPVTTLNVDEVDLDVFRIAQADIPLWSSFSNSQRRNFYQLKEFTKSNPLVYSGRFPLHHKRNQRTTTNIDLSEISELDQEGAYLAVVRIPGQYSRDYDTNFFTVSDIGLQVRKNTKSMHVLSHSMTSGQPLAKIEISLFKGKELVARQQTDKNGIATFNNWFADATTLIARQGKQSTVLRFDQPLDLSGIRNAVTRHRDTQIFAWGPRDLYRPGEKIEVFAILRDFDGRSIRAFPVKAELVDATGSLVQTVTMSPEADGSYFFKYQLAEHAKTGRWKVIYRLPADGSVMHEYPISVEDFLPERLKLTLFDGDATKIRLLDAAAPLEIPVAGQYLYGAPAAGNKADGLLLAELERHPFTQWSTYAFGIDGEKIANKKQKLAEILLDNEGAGHWSVALSPWNEVQSPLALTTTASLYESGGRPVTRSISVTLIQQDTLVGIAPEFNEQADNNSRPSFKLILTDRAGAMLSGKGYQVSLLREDRNYYWTYNDGMGWEWHYDPLEYEAYSSRVDFDGKSSVAASVPVQWGNYRLEVRDANNTLLSSYRFRTRWYWWGNAEPGSSLKPDQVRMTFQDELYQQGDTARLLLTPPTDGTATITVENNDEILWVAQQEVASGGTEIEIPIPENWYRHDIYVTATVLTPGDMVHSVAPKRSFGFINLPLKRQDAEFEVALAVPEKIQPKQSVTATVTVSADQEIPNNTYVTLAAVDVGVLNISRFVTPDPAGYLYGARRYDANYYDVYGNIIENAGFDYVQQRFGGGFMQSAAELSRGGDKPESDVMIMAWQSKPVKIAGDGSAVISMEVPEFNGKIRWMAVVYGDNSYGKAEAETIVADQLVVQISKPRFMALGDVSQLSLDLSNQSGVGQNISVEMTVSGALTVKDWQQSVNLEDHKKTTLTFPIQAEQLGRGEIIMRLHNDSSAPAQISLQRSWFIGVRSAYPAVTRKDQEIIKPGGMWQPKLAIDDLAKNSVQARLVLSSQPPINVNSHFEHLLHYPYGCTEQSTSSGYPWALVDISAAQRMGLLPLIEKEFKQSYTDAFRKVQIDKAVTRVLSRQNSNGGFGVWSNQEDEMNWLTAYATDFLVDARFAGGEVSGAALDLAIKRLQEYLKGNARIDNPWSRDGDYYGFATKSYAAYVLAKMGRLSLSDLRRFFDGVKGKSSKSGLPWVQLGHAFEVLGDAGRAKEAYDLAEATSYSEEYYGTYGSRLRDLALSYAILAKRGRATGDMLMTIFDLTREQRWLSTQERNALFRAALAAGNTDGETLRAIIKTTDFEQAIEQSTPFQSILTYKQLASITSIQGGESTVYGRMELVGQYGQAPAPYSNGLTINREYYDLEGQVKMLTEMQSGELVIVRLFATTEQDTPDALVVDLLPGGLELENQNLVSAGVDLSRMTIDGKDLKTWQNNIQGLHLEYRDDRFVAAFALHKYESVTLYYLARAVTPGQYQMAPPYIEDMYRPAQQALGSAPNMLTVKP